MGKIPLSLLLSRLSSPSTLILSSCNSTSSFIVFMSLHWMCSSMFLILSHTQDPRAGPSIHRITESTRLGKTLEIMRFNLFQMCLISVEQRGSSNHLTSPAANTLHNAKYHCPLPQGHFAGFVKLGSLGHFLSNSFSASCPLCYTGAWFISSWG